MRAACVVALGPDLKHRLVSAHNSLELVQRDKSLQVIAAKRLYFAVRCYCSHENVERPSNSSVSASRWRPVSRTSG